MKRRGVALVLLLTGQQAALALNPIVEGRGLADPHAVVFGDRTWVYASHDADRKATKFVMKDWWVWSSGDLVHWRHEGTLRPEKTYLRRPFDSCWAGFGIRHNGKYYWYFSAGRREIGVVVADRPEGPWRDPLGKPLIPEGMTPTEQRDPDLFTDDDGKVYMVFGTFRYFIVRLNDDMISLAERPRPLTVLNPRGPYNPDGRNAAQPTDDKPSLHKRDGIYYLSWSSFYAMSRNIRGPYVCKGSVIVRDLVDPGFRNQKLHHDRHGNFFSWHGQWYYIFNDKSQPGRSDRFRDSCLAYVHYRDNGEIAPIRIDRIGVGEYDAAAGRIGAADYFSVAGATVVQSPEGGFEVRGIGGATILSYPNVRKLPGNPVMRFRVACGNPEGAIIEIRDNDRNGRLLGTCRVPGRAGWRRYETVSCRLRTAPGTKNLCLVFKGGRGELLRLEWFAFAP